MIKVECFIGRSVDRIFLSAFEWESEHLTSKMHKIILGEIKRESVNAHHRIFAYIYKDSKLINGISCFLSEETGYIFDYKTMHS